MRNITRMFLIPEEIYQNLTNVSADGSALGLVRSRMQDIANNERLNVGEKAARYEQEFKRFSKLKREVEERPVNVTLRNVEQIAKAMPPPQTVVQHYASRLKPRGMGRKKNPRGGRMHGNIETDEDDVFEDASSSTKKETPTPLQPQLSSKPSSSTRHPSIEKTPREQILQYIHKNAVSLGVDSNAERYIPGIVDHLIKHRGQKKRPLPTGYEEFVRRLHAHPKLLQILEQQTGGKYYKKMEKQFVKPKKFIFKPALWI